MHLLLVVPVGMLLVNVCVYDTCCSKSLLCWRILLVLPWPNSTKWYVKKLYIASCLVPIQDFPLRTSSGYSSSGGKCMLSNTKEWNDCAVMVLCRLYFKGSRVGMIMELKRYEWENPRSAWMLSVTTIC